jgi:hypothetical protein
MEINKINSNKGAFNSFYKIVVEKQKTNITPKKKKRKK